MRIGVGIVTCNRPEFLKKLYDSIDQTKIDDLVIVNDGDELVDKFDCCIINNDRNYGVGITKNKAIKHLMNNKCDYIFIVEDDMLIKNNRVWEEYIHAYEETGIQHFMFHAHGPANKGGVSKGKSVPRAIIDYNTIKIVLYQHCVGSFCFYTKEALQKESGNDVNFINAFEHVEHSYRLAKRNFSSPYWWWADLFYSTDLIEEQACSEDSSTIRPRTDWQLQIARSAELFYKKHGVYPTTVPDLPLTEVGNILKQIKLEHDKKEENRNSSYSL